MRIGKRLLISSKYIVFYNFHIFRVPQPGYQICFSYTLLVPRNIKCKKKYIRAIHLGLQTKIPETFLGGVKVG